MSGMVYSLESNSFQKKKDEKSMELPISSSLTRMEKSLANLSEMHSGSIQKRPVHTRCINIS